MRIFWGFSLLLLLALPSAKSFADTNAVQYILPDLKTGRNAYKNKDYETAFNHFYAVAEAGFPKAKTDLARLHLYGHGVQQDPKLAYRLLRQAYSAGDKRALIDIGKLYERGLGVPVNIIEARNWYERASSEGMARGDYLIGRLYQNEKLSPYYGAPTPAISKDFIRGSLDNFHRKDFKHAEAMADMYRLGLHVEQDFKKALILMLVAEKYGSRTAVRKARLLETKVNYDDFVAAPRLAKKIYQGQAKTTIKKYAQLKPPKESFYHKAEREAQASYYFQKAADAGDKRAVQKLAELNDDGYGDESNGDEKSKPQLASLEIKQKKKYRVRGSVKTQYTFDDNFDLGTRGLDHETATVADALIGLYLYPTEKITTYLEGRGFISTGNATSNTDDDDDEESDDSFLEMRQAWVEFDEFLHPLTSLKVGRQRFYEPRAIFWNRDFDAIRLSLDSTLNKGFIAIGENQSSYRTGTEHAFKGDEKDRFRILGEYEHYLNKDNQISGRFLYEDDHSGKLTTGQVVSLTNRDDEDFNLFWAGARAQGQIKPKNDNNVSKIIYRADLMGVTGEELVHSVASGTNSNNVTVTGNNTRDVLGWAFDGNVSVLLNNKMRTALTLGYAYGSGDDGTGSNSAFRQTGLHGNSSRYPYGLTNETLRNYGMVLRPELSNIHILNAGLHLPIFNHSDMELNYFRYWLDDAATGLRSSAINAPFNGRDHYIGQEFNSSMNIYLSDEFDWSNPYMKRLALRLRFGMFDPADTYLGSNDGNAYRGTAELRYQF